MIKEVEKIIIDILAHELDLPLIYGVDVQGNQIPCFTIGYSNALLGTTDKVQIAVQTMNITPVANNTKLDTSVTPPIEKQYLSSLQTMQIDIMSANSEARQRSNEIILALDSIYSVQQQEKFQFKVNKSNTGFVNVSEAEGAQNINRFALTITCFTWYYKTKIIEEYYDQFNIYASDEKTIADIDAEIDINYNYSED